MRQIPVRFTVVSVCFLLLNAAGLVWIRHDLVAPQERSTEPLRVVETLPADDADQAERLSIVFDRDAGETDVLNARLEQTIPFEFSPELAGHWEWTTPRRLDFVLAEPLPAGRRFEVVQAAGVEEPAAAIVQVDAQIEFRTRPLKWIESRLISSDRADVTVELKFNQAVAPQQLLRHLTLREASVDGRGDTSEWDVLEADVLVDEPDESIVLRCSRPTSDRLFVSVDGALTGHNGELALGETATRTLKIAPRFVYLRNQVSDAGRGQWQIDVYFLPGLKPDQQLPSIQITPAIAGLQTNITTTWRGKGRVLRLRGPFESGREYRATLPQTLLSKDEKPLGEDEVIRFRIPQREPSVDFTHRRGILSPDGNLELDVQTVNVGALHVQLERVHSNNLVAHLQNTWRERTSRTLDGKSFRIDYEQNKTTRHTIRLRDVGAVSPGLFSVSARATDHAWTRDRALVAVTDLATTLKQSPDELLVQMTSLRQGTSVSGIRVRSVSYNNQTLASGTTDADGLVRLPVDRLHPDGRPWVVIAEHDDQIAWIRTDEDHFVDDRIDQSGRPHDAAAFDVMLYTERGTYRPGDAIHLSGIIRDADGQTPPSFPLSLHVVRPDGRTVATEVIKPGVPGTTPSGEARNSPEPTHLPGVFHFDFATPQDAWTGPWRFRVTLPGSDDELSAIHVYVEEFVPVRLEVTATTPQELWTRSAPTVHAEARYLFGPPAAGLSGEISTSYRAVRFRSAAHPEFHFGPSDLPGTQVARPVGFRLDADGHDAISLPDAPESPARWRAAVGVTVTEDGGRSVSTQCDAIVDTLQRHIGLRLPKGNVVPAGSDIALESVLRTAADESAPFEPVHFELLRVHREHVLERVNGRLTWRSTEQTESVWNRTLDETPIEDIGRLTISCEHAGQYRLIASRAAEPAVGRSVLEFTAVDDRGTTASVSRPELVDIRLDRPTCRPGETVEAVITSPFPGRLLLCLEADRVLWSRVISLQETSASLPIDIPADVRGGAFLSATVTRAVDPATDDWRPHRARGIARIVTDHSAERIPVSIDAPKSAAPGQSITVTATAGPGALVQIWAVDEGILATSGFATPDPHGHYFAQRSNGVITADVYADLLPDYRRPSDFHRIGGDAGIDSLRRNPVATPHRAAAVIWHGFQQADSDGRLSLTTTLPEFTGELRWMAVAVDGFRFGSAGRAMQVSSPLLVESAWPRFAAPGDRFQVPVKMFNTTGRAMTIDAASISWNADEPAGSTDSLDSSQAGLVTLTDFRSEDFAIDLPAGASQTVWLSIDATRTGPVAGRLALKATTNDGTLLEASTSIGLSVRPASALLTRRQFATLEAGETRTFDVLEDILPDASRSTLIVSSQSELELAPAVDSLLKYPYGCVEQTTSRLRAILAAADWMSVKSDSMSRKENVRALVQSGVSRLWAMQTRRGGLSYWPGQTDPHLWGSLWAAETLLVARERGFEIDERLLDGLQTFLTDSLSRSGGGENELDSNLRADICLVLSRMGEPPTGWMSLLSERLNELDMAGRSQLALAWHHAGRRDRALAALPADTLSLSDHVSYSGRFSSPTIQRVRLLAALLEVDPDHEWVRPLSLKVQGSRRNGVWSSTIENALAIDALAALRARSKEETPFTGQLTIGDQHIDLSAGQSRRLTFAGTGKPLTLQTTGSGRLYVSLETTGQSATLGSDDAQRVADKTKPLADHDQRLRVRRRWFNRHGHEIDPSAIRVGDLVQVEVELSATGRSTIENVAIVDALPGGLEVENPRLKTSDVGIESSRPRSALTTRSEWQTRRNSLPRSAPTTRSEWQTGRNSPADRVQFLDDRVVIFATASPSTSTFRYALRAVTEGEFVQPPVQASCMYDETLSSIHGAGHIAIAPAVERQNVERIADQKQAEEAIR